MFLKSKIPIWAEKTPDKISTFLKGPEESQSTNKTDSMSISSATGVERAEHTVEREALEGDEHRLSEGPTDLTVELVDGKDFTSQRVTQRSVPSRERGW